MTYSTTTSTGPASSASSSATTGSGQLREGSRSRVSAAARRNRGTNPSPRTMPPAAAVSAHATPTRLATTPQITAPIASEPNNVSVEIESARPRTQPAAPRCAATSRLETVVSQPAPAITIAPARTAKLLTHASTTQPSAKTAVATAVIASVDHRLRQPGNSAAPIRPP